MYSIASDHVNDPENRAQDRRPGTEAVFLRRWGKAGSIHHASVYFALDTRLRRIQFLRGRKKTAPEGRIKVSSERISEKEEILFAIETEITAITARTVNQ